MDVKIYKDGKWVETNEDETTDNNVQTTEQ
jgi:hypothetical protein